jgi:hypothetical protein
MAAVQDAWRGDALGRIAGARPLGASAALITLRPLLLRGLIDDGILAGSGRIAESRREAQDAFR